MGKAVRGRQFGLPRQQQRQRRAVQDPGHGPRIGVVVRIARFTPGTQLTDEPLDGGRALRQMLGGVQQTQRVPPTVLLDRPEDQRHDRLVLEAGVGEVVDRRLPNLLDRMEDGLFDLGDGEVHGFPREQGSPYSNMDLARCASLSEAFAA